MANYKISHDNFKKLLKKERIKLFSYEWFKSRFYRILVFTAFLLLPIYYEQWLFLVLFAIFGCLGVYVSLDSDEKSFHKDSFECGEIELRIDSDKLFMKADENEIKMNHSQIVHLIKEDKYYLLQYYSGLNLKLPIEELSDEENNTLLKIKRNIY